MNNSAQKSLKNLIFNSGSSKSGEAFTEYLLHLSSVYNNIMFSPDKTADDLKKFIDQYPDDFPYVFLGFSGEGLKTAKSYIACGDREKVNISACAALNNYPKAQEKELAVNKEIYKIVDISCRDTYYQDFETHELAYYLHALGCVEAIDKLIELGSVLSFTKPLNILKLLIDSPHPLDKTTEDLEARIQMGVEALFRDKKGINTFFENIDLNEVPYLFRSMYNRFGYLNERVVGEIFEKKEKIPTHLMVASMIIKSTHNNADYNRTFSYSEEAVVAYMNGLEAVYDKLENPKHKEKMKELVNFIIIQDNRFAKVDLSEHLIQRKFVSWISKGLFSVDLSFKNSQNNVFNTLDFFDKEQFERTNNITSDTVWLKTKFRSNKEVESFKALCEKEALESTIQAAKTGKKAQTFKL